MGAIEKIRAVAVTIENRWDRAAAKRKWKRGFSNLRILPYRGYATDDKLMMSGRVIDDLLPDKPQMGDSVWDNIRGIWRRFETDEIPGARVRLTVRGKPHEAETDKEGFFHFSIGLAGPLPVERMWHTFPLEIVRPTRQPPLKADAHIVAPSPRSEFVIVSDMDDTVIRTGATHALRKVLTVVLNNAHSRSPFEKVGDFYRALCRGPKGTGYNPLLYVSSSPWNLYEMFEEFMAAHDIPHGPIFLKDYGLSPQHFLKSSHRAHKIDKIEMLMNTWPHLPFVLIGDSGQKDPEIYQHIVNQHPKRVRAILIRDVSGKKRDREVRAIADEVTQRGTPLILAENTKEVAQQAAQLGLIRLNS